MLEDDKKKFLLSQACQRARYDMDDLFHAVKVGTAQFIDSENGCAVTSIIKSGSWVILEILVVGANEEGVLELSKLIDKAARDWGCNVIRTEGREGFQLKKDRGNQTYAAAMAGFKPVAIVYEKLLNEGQENVVA